MYHIYYRTIQDIIIIIRERLLFIIGLGSPGDNDV